MKNSRLRIGEESWAFQGDFTDLLFIFIYLKPPVIIHCFSIIIIFIPFNLEYICSRIHRQFCEIDIKWTGCQVLGNRDTRTKREGDRWNLARLPQVRFSFRLIREQSLNEPSRKIYSPSFAFHATATRCIRNRGSRLTKAVNRSINGRVRTWPVARIFAKAKAVSEGLINAPDRCVREREIHLARVEPGAFISPSSSHLAEFKCGINWDARETKAPSSSSEDFVHPIYLGVQ